MHFMIAMRVLVAVLPLLLVSGNWAASIASPEPADNENSTEPAAAQPAQSSGALGGPAAAPPAHPMAAYLALRPALPAKPTFFPPFVDSKAFVDRKAALLSSLFGLPPPAPAAPVAPAGPAPGPVTGPVFPWFAPGFFASKKNSFLNALFAAQAGSPYAAQQPLYSAQQPTYFAAQQPATQARRAIFGMYPFGGPPPGLVIGPSVFAAKKAAFLQKLFETLNATEAPPTPAPIPSWLDLLDDVSQRDDNAATADASAADAAPDTQQPLARVPLTQASAPIDPSAKRAQFLSALFDSLGLPPPTPKPTIVPPSFWSPFADPAAYPFVKPTIVPPDFWAPAGKPSPGALYKAKVASFLGNLFQQVNATAAPKRKCCGSSSGANRRNVRAAEETPGVAEEASPVERRGVLGGPFGGAFGGPFGGPFGPFGVGKPFGPTVDPKFFMDKKTAFLNQLFASKAASAAATADSNSADAGSSPSFGPFGPYGFAPTPKPTIVPPDFWNPFPAGAAPAAPGVKPTVVPPSFWSPFAALKSTTPAAAAPAPGPAGVFADKKAQFLSALFALKATTTPAPPPPPAQEEQPEDDDEAEFDDFLQELAESLAGPDVVYLSRRSLAPGSADAARQQLIDSAVAQMATLKNDIVSTVNEILKQKEAAAQQPAFPFAKGPYAAYGAMKKGGPPPGVTSKKGGPPPGVMTKKGGPPGGFPFWGGAAPTPDPTAPLQQRLQVLSQAFDSLAALEKDASAALQSAPGAGPAPFSAPAPAPAAAPSADAAALLQLLRQAAAAEGLSPGAKGARKGKGARVPPAPRSLQFAVRQGQFSLPPGAEELLTAGGGTTPGQQEGGGLRLQIKVPTA